MLLTRVGGASTGPSDLDDNESVWVDNTTVLTGHQSTSFQGLSSILFFGVNELENPVHQLLWEDGVHDQDRVKYAGRVWTTGKVRVWKQNGKWELFLIQDRI